jgi:hypothetical protein
MDFIFIISLHFLISMRDLNEYLVDEVVSESKPTLEEVIKTSITDHFYHLPHSPHTSLASFIISEIQTLAKIPTKF